MTGSAVLLRLVEGIRFRFTWATEGLREQDLSFRPTPETMCIAEQAGHVLGLVCWVAMATGALPADQKPTEPPPPFAPVRQLVLEVLGLLRARLADALTHIGQINVLRRASGNPVPKANVFLGRPPR